MECVDGVLERGEGVGTAVGEGFVIGEKDGVGGGGEHLCTTVWFG